MKVVLIIVVLIALVGVGGTYLRGELARRRKEREQHLRRSIAVTKRASGIYGKK